MKIFVTVGTTEFQQLVDMLISSDAQNLLSGHQVTIQYGSIKPDRAPDTYTLLDYTERFNEYLVENDLIISTASAGVRLDVIAHKKPHLMVCNSTLAGNHQLEMIEVNKDNPSCRAFEGPKQLLEYLRTANLEEECKSMIPHIKTSAGGEAEFKQLCENLMTRRHKNNIWKLTLVVFCVAGAVVWLLEQHSFS